MADEQPRFLQGLERLHNELRSLEPPLRRTAVTVIPSNQSAGFQIDAGVAETPQAVADGLMFRRDLGPDEGMLFLFPDVRPRQFWMKNTLIWLDMIFIGQDNEVVGVIHNAKPLSEELRGFDAPVKAVLEVNAGWCWAHNVDAGAFVTWPEDQEKAAAEFSGKVCDGPDKTIKEIIIQGIPVDIERPKGSVKIFKDKTTQFYNNDYGSIPLAKGVDGDPLDVFVGPDKGSKRVFIVDKMDDKDHSKFDEHKVMLGFKDRKGARQAAEFHLWGTDGKIREMPVGALQKALGQEKKAAEFAPGIPEKGRFIGIPDIQKPTTWEFGLHLHKAHRAGCFVAGSPVRLADGTYRAIQDVRPGDVVPSSRGLAKVVRVWDNGPALDWVEVESHESKIICTSNHRFFVDGEGWVEIGSIGSLAYLDSATGKIVRDLQSQDPPQALHMRESKVHQDLEESKGRGGASGAPTDEVPTAVGSCVDQGAVREGTQCPGGRGADRREQGCRRRCDALLQDPISAGEERALQGQTARGEQLELEGRHVQREALGLQWGELAEGAAQEEDDRVEGKEVRVVRSYQGPHRTTPSGTLQVFGGARSGECGLAVSEGPQGSGRGIRGGGWQVLRIRRLPRVARDRFDLEVEGEHSYFVGPFLVHNSHFDLRLGDPTTGEAHSWAMKKLPEPGKSTYAPQQPTHTVEYMDWKGEIPAGTYGAGTVELARRDKAEVLKAHDNEIRFNLYQGRVPEQFVMKRQTGRMWTIHNVTPSREVKKWQELIPSDKPSMKSLPIGKISPAIGDQVWQPKIDGAHGIAVLEANKPMRVFSYREAKNQTGLIEHTFRMPDFHQNIVPAGMRPTVIRGELWGDKGGKPIPVGQLGGLLNASVPESRQRQMTQGIKLHFTAEDVDRYEGKKIGIQPFERTDQILKDLASQVSGIEVMPSAVTPVQKEKLLQQVRSGKHKLTREGIVVRSRRTAEMWKAKEFDPHDVFVQQVYLGTKPGEAGGFRYSWTEHGPIVGNVGSGLTHQQRTDMLQNPENWVGRVAKVKAQEKLRSGALRVPVFTGFHETKGLQPYHEIASSE